MGKLLFLSVGSVIVGSLIIAACVADEATAPAEMGAQGELGGPCFANGTCQDPLACGVVKGVAQCVAGGDASVGDSSPADDAGTTTDSASDSAPTDCIFNTTVFPCKDPNPHIACYGGVVNCTGSGCGPAEVEWECFSPRQCNNPLVACCMPIANAALSVGATCAEGSLQMKDGGTTGGLCGTTAGPCGSSDMQLCQAKSDCPSGQQCKPVKVHGGGASLDALVDIGVCVPQ